MTELLERGPALTPTFTLTDDQQAALEAFQSFLLDPAETTFILKGYSGCGKSTLVKYLIDLLPKLIKAARLLDPSIPEYVIDLTATTNKAAENLSLITGAHACTIHALLGLRVQTDFKTRETKLVRSKSVSGLKDRIIFIDEASYIDQYLLNNIYQYTSNCKIVFIGDPAQLTPVKSSNTPAFALKAPTAELTKVVRQANGNPIIDLATKFRETVNTGRFFSFRPDGHHVIHLDRDAFDEEIKKEFLRPDWKFRDSKILAWTNQRVVDYNHAIQALMTGDPSFQEGDYAVCNNFLTVSRVTFKTDQMVQITEISGPKEQYDIQGRNYLLDDRVWVFMPDHFKDRQKRLKQAHADGYDHILFTIETEWADLRSAYACTINKSQGSTYDKVFIDLDDVRRCNSGDQIARMLYVAVSRARHQVFLTGDLA